MSEDPSPLLVLLALAGTALTGALIFVMKTFFGTKLPKGRTTVPRPTADEDRRQAEIQADAAERRLEREAIEADPDPDEQAERLAKWAAKPPGDA